MKTKIKELLLKVDKPARYSGGEFNARTPKENAELRYLMCFPDVYEVAMSNLGIKILIDIINRRDECSCESCFAPMPDMGNALKEADESLYSLESFRPMSEFNMIGFSLQYEMSYTNVLYMLELGRVPLFAKERGEDCPIVMAGGPCAVNPNPVLPFFDLISIGDGEETMDMLCALYVKNKREAGTRDDFLRAAANIEGIYVPKFSKTAKRAVISSLEDAWCPTKFVIPNVEAVFNRAVLEIFRGCTRGCRFCQAGYIYRPVRERSVDKLAAYTRELIDNCGFDEITLSSLSTCDYTHLKELLLKIKPLTDQNRVTIALPSTRVDSFEAEYVTSSRLSSLTFAPEAGTQRMRDVINKNVTEEDIMTSVKYAFEKGYSSVKLYFMIGLPTETDEDILAIADLAARIKASYRQHSTNKKQLTLSVSTSTFIPKPFTPFQWEAQISLEEIERRQNLLKDKLRERKIKYGWHDGKTSVIEAILARGDQKTADAVYQAYKLGCMFDSWSEHFDYDKWIESFNLCGINPNDYTGEFDIDQELSWDYIDVGLSKEFFKSEYRKSRQVTTTNDCRKNCHNCGINFAYKDAFKNNCVKSIESNGQTEPTK